MDILKRDKKKEPEVLVIDGKHVSPTVCEDVLEGKYDKINKKCYVSRRKVDEHRSLLEELNIKVIQNEENEIEEE